MLDSLPAYNSSILIFHFYILNFWPPAAGTPSCLWGPPTWVGFCGHMCFLELTSSALQTHMAHSPSPRNEGAFMLVIAAFYRASHVLFFTSNLTRSCCSLRCKKVSISYTQVNCWTCSCSESSCLSHPLCSLHRSYCRKIIMGPLCCYSRGPCCNNPMHHTNYGESSYLRELGELHLQGQGIP